MKKVFILAFLALGMMFANMANAQGLKFGLKAGLNVTDIHLSSEVFDKTNRAGWFAGPTVKFSLPLLGLGVDAAALYDVRSAKVANTKLEERTIKQEQITIPVNLRYSIGLGSSANIFVFAGPQWGFNVGDKDFKWTNGSSYSLKKSNFSVNAGLGFTVLNHLQVSANYNVAFGKTADVKILDALSDAAGQIVGSKGKSRNNSWQIALAYYF
ncbi:porin family protein [Prevotella sp. HUN102]|uniref:porin family protein n=1 Tax=Prevotella sp. HUN102 TaxID=1392486 RepID=UPI00048BE9D0|nr:porin family protein [Prevotella sp. HUN102]